MSELLQSIAALPVAERLQIVEEIMIGIHNSGESVPIQDWHRQEIRRRVAETPEEDYIDRDELWRRVGRQE